jgi:hypothetical protein
MSNYEFNGGEDEREAAEDRIRRIREGGSAAPEPASSYDDGLGESDAVIRARARAQAAREALTADERSVTGSREGQKKSGGRGRQAVVVIGGIVAIGVLIVLIVLMIRGLTGGGGLTFGATKTPTPTATPDSTATPLPTETPTPTKKAPSTLALPPLTCIFQSGQGCFDYCADAANTTECNSASDFVRAQGADPEFWLDCIAPGPGANVGNPQVCLEDAWRELNP